MNKIKNFREFINEGLFDKAANVNFLSTFGKIISGEKDSVHFEKERGTKEDDGSSAPDLESSYSGKMLSAKGTYSSPNLSLSSKYSTASRVNGILRKDSDIFQICLHHTDGENLKGEDIIKFVYSNGEGSSVHYAIGRDGQLVKGSPENESVWASNGLNAHSISIEIATGGGLSLRDSKWYDGNAVLNEKYFPLIIDLGYTYNGHRYYLDYTDGQMRSLKEFIDMTIEKYPEIKKGMNGNVYEKVFGIPDPSLEGDYKSKHITEKQAAEERGIFIHAVAPKATHTDCFPSSKLVNLLKEYGYTGNVIESTYVYSEEVKGVEKEKEKKEEKYKTKKFKELDKYFKRIYGNETPPKNLGVDKIIQLGITPKTYKEYIEYRNKAKI
jgi:hypothetical protein